MSIMERSGTVDTAFYSIRFFRTRCVVLERIGLEYIVHRAKNMPLTKFLTLVLYKICVQGTYGKRYSLYFMEFLLGATFVPGIQCSVFAESSHLT